MSPGRPVCGHRWEARGWGRRAFARHFIGTDLCPFPQYHFPGGLPTQTDRHAQEGSLHPSSPHWQFAPRFLSVQLSTSAQRPAIYISLERETGPPASLLPSPSWQLLITSSAGCSLLPLAEATRNKCTCIQIKHPREVTPLIPTPISRQSMTTQGLPLGSRLYTHNALL